MNKFKKGDVIYKPASPTQSERTVFVDRELQPGFYLGILLEDDRGRFYTSTVEKENGYELVAEGVAADLIETMRKHNEENPPPAIDPEKLKILFEDMKAYGLIK